MNWWAPTTDTIRCRSVTYSLLLPLFAYWEIFIGVIYLVMQLFVSVFRVLLCWFVPGSVPKHLDPSRGLVPSSPIVGHGLEISDRSAEMVGKNGTDPSGRRAAVMTRQSGPTRISVGCKQSGKRALSLKQHHRLIRLS